MARYVSIVAVYCLLTRLMCIGKSWARSMCCDSSVRLVQHDRLTNADVFRHSVWYVVEPKKNGLKEVFSLTLQLSVYM